MSGEIVRYDALFALGQRTGGIVYVERWQPLQSPRGAQLLDEIMRAAREDRRVPL